jgi:hypothetical protein
LEKVSQDREGVPPESLASFCSEMECHCINNM